jgi:hybrid cluster-associated redox disulfide protein
MPKITKDTIVADVLKMDQETAPIFIKHGLFCLGCPASSMESIEQAGTVHGLNIDELLKDLNNYFDKTKK